MPVFFWNDADGSRYRDAYFDNYPGVWRHGDWVTITDRRHLSSCTAVPIHAQPHGVRLGSADIYHAVEGVPEIADCLVVGIDEPDGGYWMPLFVALAAEPNWTRTCGTRIKAAIRAGASPRHVPDEIIAVPGCPGPAPARRSRSRSNGSSRAPRPATSSPRARWTGPSCSRFSPNTPDRENWRRRIELVCRDLCPRDRGLHFLQPSIIGIYGKLTSVQSSCSPRSPASRQPARWAPIRHKRPPTLRHLPNPRGWGAVGGVAVWRCGGCPTVAPSPTSVFNKSAMNFNPLAAMAGKLTIAQVEELVQPGDIDPAAGASAGGVRSTHRRHRNPEQADREADRPQRQKETTDDLAPQPGGHVTRWPPAPPRRWSTANTSTSASACPRSSPDISARRHRDPAFGERHPGHRPLPRRRRRSTPT